MALTDRLMDNLRVKLPGAIDPSIKNELWNTVNDACRNGHLWRETVDVPLVEGDNTYYPTPDGAEILHIFQISHPTLDVSNAVFDLGILVLTTLPRAADLEYPAFLNAALAPSLDAGADPENLIPADMWSEHFQLWLDGTLARMMAQPAKPYSNPALAAFHLRAYNGALAQARHKVRTGGIPGAQMWRYPRWAR